MELEKKEKYIQYELISLSRQINAGMNRGVFPHTNDEAEATRSGSLYENHINASWPNALGVDEMEETLIHREYDYEDCTSLAETPNVM